MVRSGQHGFTLVEVVIVLAISGLLLLIAFNGFAGARIQSEYTLSVDGTKEAVSQAKAAALASVNTVGTGNGGGGACKTIVGEMLSFSTALPSIRLQTVGSYNTRITGCPQTFSILAASPASYTYEYGLRYTGYELGGVNHPGQPYNILFTRSQADASMLVTGIPTVPTNYAQVTAILTQTVQLNFSTPEGRVASVLIDPTGGITRVFQ